MNDNNIKVIYVNYKPVYKNYIDNKYHLIVALCLCVVEIILLNWLPLVDRDYRYNYGKLIIFFIWLISLKYYIYDKIVNHKNTAMNVYKVSVLFFLLYLIEISLIYIFYKSANFLLIGMAKNIKSMLYFEIVYYTIYSAFIIAILLLSTFSSIYTCSFIDNNGNKNPIGLFSKLGRWYWNLFLKVAFIFVSFQIMNEIATHIFEKMFGTSDYEWRFDLIQVSLFFFTRYIGAISWCVLLLVIIAKTYKKSVNWEKSNAP